MWRIKHNWNCRGPENRSRESVWGFESLILRQCKMKALAGTELH